MSIDEIKEIVTPYVEVITDFNIEDSLFLNNDGRKNYTNLIREKVLAKRIGVYLVLNENTGEIIYIGRAGTIKNNDSQANHFLTNRLNASRGKDVNKKDIQSNDYFKSVMIDHQITSLKFILLYSKNAEPPAYLEALLLYHFYKKNNKLPKLNKSF